MAAVEAAYHAKSVIGSIAAICLGQPDDLVCHIAANALHVPASHCALVCEHWMAGVTTAAAEAGKLPMLHSFMLV